MKLILFNSQEKRTLSGFSLLDANGIKPFKGRDHGCGLAYGGGNSPRLGTGFGGGGCSGTDNMFTRGEGRGQKGIRDYETNKY